MRPRPIPGFRALASSAAALALAGCATAPPGGDAPPPFDAWRAQAGDAVAAFDAWLQLEGVSREVPLAQLLRTASSWRRCDAAPYAVPPPPQWPDVARVLRLVQALRAAGALGAFEVHSGYREPALNACAGGAARSAHQRAFAIDLTPRGPPGAPATLAALCAFWRAQGPAWQMGFGQYPGGRIHLDTAGWRSWGADGRSGSSPCTPPG